MQIYYDKSFKNPIKIIQAFNNEEFVKAFDEIEKYRKDKFLLGYIRYEAKNIFLGDDIKSSLPLLYFEVYNEFDKYSPNSKINSINIETTPCLHYSRYKQAVEKIKNEIVNGNTYEVNYTYDFEVNADADDFTLYEYLLSKQKTPYNCFIKNDYETLLSFSPELFFELKDNHIVTKPMKGTIQRGVSIEEDEKLKKFLFNDEKNRAENVMIVDLLRNDLGKIAKTGSVKVSKLFEIETHKTLHQMTSQIEADLDNKTKLLDIFKAIFPCGSITGAPKISTMRIIDEVETGARNIYCGAIGFISPEKTEFSVPIRILQKKNSDESFKYRVGGAIVWDSNTQEEWEETYTKIKFLNCDFKLIETIKVEKGKLIYLEEHLERLRNSAVQLGFNTKFNEPSDIKVQNGILRILLNRNGILEHEYREIKESFTDIVEISPITVKSTNRMMFHKSSYRPWFAESYEKIHKGIVYDEIFFNEKGELTEGARNNIVIEKKGEFYTPPLSCGLLNGIYRQKMLEEGKCKEKILYMKDLINADNIYCINSVRGIKKVHLKGVLCKV